jgi:hypothetical protein
MYLKEILLGIVEQTSLTPEMHYSDSSKYSKAIAVLYLDGSFLASKYSTDFNEEFCCTELL